MSVYKNFNTFTNIKELFKYILPLKKEGKSIVTTNGCFDILHVGHIQYLKEAASHGDILIVGVNCDKVVHKLKGGNRPIQNENDRVSIIGALKMVNFAFIFYEDNPCSFINIIKPDIHVKGGDYSENIIEKPSVEAHGGRIAIVSFKKGYSSSGIIRKIASK
jgi:glycerol-3-phosphate cytidylyltransferase